MKCADCKWCETQPLNWTTCRYDPPVYIKAYDRWDFPNVKPDDWCRHFESKIIPLDVVETKVSDK